MVEYVRRLIALRKAHPAFRMRTTDQIAEHLRFLDVAVPNVVAYRLNGAAAGDSWRDLWVAYNGSAEPQSLPLPEGSWKVALLDDEIYAEEDMQPVAKGVFELPAIAAAILVRESR